MPSARPTRDEYIHELENRIAELRHQLDKDRELHRQQRQQLQDELKKTQGELELARTAMNELASALQENKQSFDKYAEHTAKLLEAQVKGQERMLLLLEGDEKGAIPGLCKTQEKHDERLKSLEQTRALMYALGAIISFGYYFLEDKLKALLK